MWLLSAAALAACPERASRMQVGQALGEVTDALEDGDLDDARARLAALANRLACLDEPMDRALLARYARQQALVALEAADRESAARWAMLARLTDPALALDGPLKALVDGIPDPPLVRAEGGLVSPKGGGVFVDGVLVVWPEAPDGLPAVVQVFDSDRILFDGWWQAGAEFPGVLLSPTSRPLPPPDWQDAARPAPSAAGRSGTVAPLLAGAALLATSGVTYALAGRSAASMDGVRTSEDLTAARSRANAFVVASGASFAGALTVGVGVLLDL